VAETPAAAQDRAPRRLVLLDGDEQSAVSQVLKEYSGQAVGASRIHADLVQAAEEHPGVCAAVEWLAPIGWTRYLWCRR